MKANLFIKGQKEPVELEELEARAAERLIGSASQPFDTPFSIEGVWSGKKADMRYVIWPKKEVATVNRSEVAPMSMSEAEAFEKEIEQDKAEAVKFYGNDKEGNPRSYKWREFYLQRNGAIRIERVDSPLGIVSSRWFSRDSDKLVELETAIESYWSFKRKQDYAEAKKIEQYAKMAEEWPEDTSLETAGEGVILLGSNQKENVS